jgi:hypothetical protein
MIYAVHANASQSDSLSLSKNTQKTPRLSGRVVSGTRIYSGVYLTVGKVARLTTRSQVFGT